jgi:transcriptional regulator with XRE-family HTH domain
MRCGACAAMVGRWSTSPLCPACHAAAGAVFPLPDQRRAHSALWLWTSDTARAALATGNLAVIVRAYRAATGTSQRQLAELLAYDPTYISMIETGRRDIKDVAARLRIARQLGVPAQCLGVSDPEDADFTAMLQFGESTIRLAVIARQAGHGAEAVNELWPLVTRLEARVADDHTERDVLLLLARARAELGVSLGYVLSEERLVSAARWTGRALWLAARLDDQELLSFALRVHGNELRKTNRTGAAVARLGLAAQLVSERDRGAALVQLARAAGELGDRLLFDQLVESARRLADSRHVDRSRALMPSMRCTCAAWSVQGERDEPSSCSTGTRCRRQRFHPNGSPSCRSREVKCWWLAPMPTKRQPPSGPRLALPNATGSHIRSSASYERAGRTYPPLVSSRGPPSTG